MKGSSLFFFFFFFQPRKHFDSDTDSLSLMVGFDMLTCLNGISLINWPSLRAGKILQILCSDRLPKHANRWIADQHEFIQTAAVSWQVKARSYKVKLKEMKHDIFH